MNPDKSKILRILIQNKKAILFWGWLLYTLRNYIFSLIRADLP